MKKAYVKPVFLAEEFVAEMSYANNGCGVSVYTPAEITRAKDHKAAEGTTADLCFDSEDGHYVSYDAGLSQKYVYDETMDYWGYATSGTTEKEKQATLFVTVLCDFVWNPNTGNRGDVSVWDTAVGRVEDGNYKSAVVGQFMKFFTGRNPSENGGHVFAYQGHLSPFST